MANRFCLQCKETTKCEECNEAHKNHAVIRDQKDQKKWVEIYESIPSPNNIKMQIENDCKPTIIGYIDQYINEIEKSCEQIDQQIKDAVTDDSECSIKLKLYDTFKQNINTQEMLTQIIETQINAKFNNITQINPQIRPISSQLNILVGSYHTKAMLHKEFYLNSYSLLRSQYGQLAIVLKRVAEDDENRVEFARIPDKKTSFDTPGGDGSNDSIQTETSHLIRSRSIKNDTDETFPQQEKLKLRGEHYVNKDNINDYLTKNNFTVKRMTIIDDLYELQQIPTKLDQQSHLILCKYCNKDSNQHITNYLDNAKNISKLSIVNNDCSNIFSHLPITLTYLGLLNNYISEYKIMITDLIKYLTTNRNVTSLEISSIIISQPIPVN